MRSLVTVTDAEMEQLRAEANDLRNAIFAYEMSGELHRIDDANTRLDEIYARIETLRLE